MEFDSNNLPEKRDIDKEEYILVKLSDDAFNGFHPNGIDEGHTIIGTFENPPTVGERFVLRGTRFRDYLRTSVVEEILDDSTFKTTYSTYKLTPYEKE